MTFCGQCGTEIAEKDGFCTNCGRKAAAKKEQQTEQSVNNWTDLYQSTKKLSKKFPGIYKTFKLNKITKFELTNYDFLSIADTKTKNLLVKQINEWPID